MMQRHPPPLISSNDNIFTLPKPPSQRLSSTSSFPFDLPHQRNMNGFSHDDNQVSAPASASGSGFDILAWHPAYLSCMRYFVDHAQHEPATQALCALINIRLPFQWLNNPITSSSQRASTPNNQQQSYAFSSYPRNNGFSPGNSRSPTDQSSSAYVSLVPYLRRLIVTAFDKPPILHGFFGDDYVKGIMPHIECERRNYLFAAKHGGWRSCKKQYDAGSGGGGDESVPFLKPLDEAKMVELTAAEKAWSSWLAMEDWMVGPRAPDDSNTSSQQTGSGNGNGNGGLRGARGGHENNHSNHHSAQFPDNLPDGIPQELPDAFTPQYERNSR